MYSQWCWFYRKRVNGYDLKLIGIKDDYYEVACESVATVVPSHYTSEERMANILENLGKAGAADYLREKLPNRIKNRSADMGEILATEYIDKYSEYLIPVKRLRWKDHREMPMRGDDIIGIALDDGDFPVRFLKGEVKSRASLTTEVVEQAREALNNCGGLPTPHSLSFVSDRLYDNAQYDLAIKIDLVQLNGISNQQVQHLLFTFCGNNPNRFLEKDLSQYNGSIHQNAVGLMINKHQEFITKIYNLLGGRQT